LCFIYGNHCSWWSEKSQPVFVEIIKRTFAWEINMNAEIKNIIISELREYNPVMIGIFGSYSRNENHHASDIDILVKFKSTLSLLQLVHAERMISQKLGIKVDLVTEGAIKHKIVKENIKKDLQIIFQ
jgi:predicted nucleotidyltransferase